RILADDYDGKGVAGLGAFVAREPSSMTNESAPSGPENSRALQDDTVGRDGARCPRRCDARPPDAGQTKVFLEERGHDWTPTRTAPDARANPRPLIRNHGPVHAWIERDESSGCLSRSPRARGDRRARARAAGRARGTRAHPRGGH